jgi:SHS2 domain-containing protein
VAFEASGKDLAELFRSAADAMMNIMIDSLETIEKRESLEFVVHNDDLEMSK